MTSDPVAEGRSMLRLMRLLRSGPARPSPASLHGTVLFTCGERGSVAVGRDALKKALKAGLLTMNADGLVALSERGQRVASGQASAPGALSPAQREETTRTMDGPFGRERVIFNQAESPLTQIAARRDRNGQPFLSQSEVDAGERLRADYEQASIVPRLGINWEQPIAKGKAGAARPQGLEMSETVLAARQRVEKAIAAVGPDLAGILIDICCFLKGLERVEAERGWPVRSAKIVLRTALRALDRHYRPSAAPRGRVLHWGSADFRPELRGADR